MNSAKTQISIALKEIEDEIQRLRDAANHLKEALKFVEGVSANAASPPSLTPQFSISSQESVSLLVDKYLDSLDKGDEFLVGDVISAVCSGGYENTNVLRGSVSNVLSRRVKAGAINRVGLRGSFIKPVKPTEEKRTFPEDDEAF